MQENTYDINRLKIVYPLSQGQASLKHDSSMWPPDYNYVTVSNLWNRCMLRDKTHQNGKLLKH